LDTTEKNTNPVLTYSPKNQRHWFCLQIFIITLLNNALLMS